MQNNKFFDSLIKSIIDRYIISNILLPFLSKNKKDISSKLKPEEINYIENRWKIASWLYTMIILIIIVSGILISALMYDKNIYPTIKLISYSQALFYTKLILGLITYIYSLMFLVPFLIFPIFFGKGFLTLLKYEKITDSIDTYEKGSHKYLPGIFETNFTKHLKLSFFIFIVFLLIVLA